LADSRRYSSLLVDELEVRKRFKDQFECVNAIKWRHIKNSLQYKVFHSKSPLFSYSVFRNHFVDGIYMGDLKVERATHMLKPSYFATLLLD